MERAYFRRQAETSDAELVPTRTGRGPFSFGKRKWGAEPSPRQGAEPKEMGKIVGLPHKSIRTIESGLRSTTIEKLILLAKVFRHIH